ncbi:MAG: hypothetical protein ACKVKM_08940, partial [Verrucomicrobiia bacterium]
VHLNDLGFAQSQLDVALTTTAVAAEAKATGLDTVEFQFAPNPGEPARPLRAIASSGELARVMLALKTVLAAEDSIPVLILMKSTPTSAAKPPTPSASECAKSPTNAKCSASPISPP